MALSVGGPPNKRMKLSIALAPAPRRIPEGHSACPPFGGHRALAAYPRCSTDSLASALLLATEVARTTGTTWPGRSAQRLGQVASWQ